MTDAIEQIRGSWLSVSRQAGQPAIEARLVAAGIHLGKAARLVLAHLAHRGPLLISELAVLSGVDVSTMSRTLRPMSEAGLIGRQPGETDLRCIHVSLTPAGEEVHHRILALARELLNEVLSDWSQEDRELLARLLDRFSEAFSAYFATPEPVPS